MTSITSRWSTGLLTGRSFYLTLALLSLGFAIALARGAVTDANNTVADNRLTPASGKKEEQRMREGTVLVDEVGYFKRTGDRAMFYKSGQKHGMGVLENLNLQRVIERITDNADQLEWVLTGTVTEFKNRNYLIVDRVVLKNSVE
jgi:hypothetical protein